MTITIRIDEFSTPGDIDGSLSTEEQTRFLTFGFDIALDEPVVVVTPGQRIMFIMKESRGIKIDKESRLLTLNKENRKITVC